MKYIIFTPNIANIGGAQLYTKRRAQFLIKNGYEVKIITSKSTPLLIEAFKDFDILTIKQFASFKYTPTFYSNRLIRKISDFIGNADYIESHTLNDAIFCEIIAKKLKLKSIVYLLLESKISALKDERFRSFYEFKLKRGELWGLSEPSLDIIFERNIDKGLNNFINIGFDVNEFSNDDTFFLPQKKEDSDFIIATITRLEKEYLIDFITSVYKFCEGKNFTTHLMVYGDSRIPGLKAKLKSTYKGNANLSIYWPGYLNPIPSKLFKTVDVYAGMGTTVVNSIAMGCPTLVIDPRTNQCAGIFGKEINNFGYSTDQLFSIEEKLFEIYNLSGFERKKLSDHSIDFFYKNYENKIVMQKAQDLIKNSKIDKEYYNFDFNYSLQESLYKIFVSLKTLKYLITQK